MNKKQLIQAINYTFRRTSTETIMFHQAVADALDLNITDHKCMELLNRLGPMTAGKLSELTGLTTGAVTGIVDRLEKAKLAKRTTDPKDRRKIIITLADNKTVSKKLWKIFGSMSKAMEEVLSGYNEKELKLFLDFMTNVLEKSQEVRVKLRRRQSKHKN